MADNTIIQAPGSAGDTIRDVDRGAAAGGPSLKTQVMALDVGGSAARAELLVAKDAPMPVDAGGGLMRVQNFLLMQIAAAHPWQMGAPELPAFLTGL